MIDRRSIDIVFWSLGLIAFVGLAYGIFVLGPQWGQRIYECEQSGGTWMRTHGKSSECVRP